MGRMAAEEMAEMAEMEVTESEGDRRKCILYHVQLCHSEMFGRPRTVLSFVRAMVRAQMRGSIGAVRELANSVLSQSHVCSLYPRLYHVIFTGCLCNARETYRIQSNLQRHNSMNTVTIRTHESLSRERPVTPAWTGPSMGPSLSQCVPLPTWW